LLPEIKILLYIIFIISLFFIHDLNVYLFILFGILILLLRIPFGTLKKGWLPISLFLVFTFAGNALFQQGKILYNAGPFIITEEGFYTASIRTMRVFFMIAGAKILTGTTDIELLVNALGRILRPLERFKIPVSEFFSTMGLTMKYLPELKEQIIRSYKKELQNSHLKGFWNRARIISMFLIPLFVKSIQSPEMFFKNEVNNEKKD